MEIFQFNINLQTKLTCVKARGRHTLLYINIGTGKSGEAQEKEERQIQCHSLCSSAFFSYLCTSMKARIKTILLFIFVFCLGAQAQMHRYSVNFNVSEKDFVDTIPIRFIDDQIYIEVEMANGDKRLFNFDTGSSQGMVYYEGRIDTNDELGNIVSKDANGRKDTVKVIRIPEFKMGSITIGNYVATVINQPHGRRNYDAILGFDLLNKGLLCKIDVRNKRMILTDRKHFFKQEGGYQIRYKLRWFVPHVWISPFIRHVDETLFDTGTRQFYSMNKQSFDKHAFKSHQVNDQVEGRSRGHLSIGNYGAEEVDEVVFLKLDRLKWGEFAFNNVSSLTTQGGSRLGAAMLNYGSLIINPLKKRMLFQPYNDSDTCEVRNKQFDMAFVPVDGRAAVGLIRDTCDEYEQGMRQGDIILRINDDDIPDFQSFAHYPFVEGETYTFILLDQKGFKKTVKSIR